MEAIQNAEKELDNIFRYLKANEQLLFHDDVASTRYRLTSIIGTNSGVDMINTARQSLGACINFWAQTYDKHTELTQSLVKLAGHLEEIWKERKNETVAKKRKELKRLLNEAHQRIIEKINAFLGDFITEKKVTNRGNGGREYIPPRHKRGARRKNR